MASKLGFKQLSKNQYVKDFLKNSKELRAGFATPEEAKTYHSHNWYNEYALKNNDFSLISLLRPEHKQLKIQTQSNLIPNHKCSLIGYNGFWRILIHYRNSKSLDFDISVTAGSDYRFHSKVIKHSISSRFGEETYQQWRKMIKSDIDSLKVLVIAMRARINSIAWSYTCSPSAARLCEQVGISTYRGAAFLFPSSYE